MSGTPSIPDFMRKRMERAIEEALHPKGMSTHDGYARIQASDVQRLFAALQEVAEKEAARKGWHDQYLDAKAAQYRAEDALRAAQQEAARLRGALEPFTQMRTDSRSFVRDFTCATVAAAAALAVSQAGKEDGHG